MTATVVLRPMTEADLDAVHALEVAASPDPWSRDLLAAELRGDGRDRLWLVAVSGPDPASIIGFGGILQVVDEAHVMNVVVAPDHRRRGVASRLLAELVVRIADRGATAATLEVRVDNGPAVELYHRFGFELVGRRPRYYPDGTDAEIRWCHRLHHPATRARLERLGGLDESGSPS